jgi:FKBP-type peptidyl-prolyl cis-trans isomerase FklB
MSQRTLARGLVTLSLVLSATLAAAADTAAPVSAPTDEASNMSYALGYQIGRDMRGVTLQPEQVVKGLQDAASGTTPRLSFDQIQALVQKLQKQADAERAKRRAAELEKTADAGAAYLAENAKQQGVVTTASGLQYRVITPGTGRKPTASDTVTVNYRGTLVDGAVFDSSYERGQPATFQVSGVIPGWTEGLQLMQEGGKSEFVIPASLAYGDRGPLANQVLVFEVELIKVGAPDAAH